MKRILCLVLVLVMGMALCACGNNTAKGSLWDTALYTENTEIGNGEKTLTIDVIAEDKTVTFTVNTDKDTLGEALMECELIAGDKSSYGLYVKFVNGIEADYDKSKTYWGITKNGESLMTGVDAEEIQDGSKYEFTYSK